MQRLLSLRAVIDVILDTIRDVAAARSAGVLCCVLMVMGGIARAQTGGPADPSPVPAQSAKDDDMPPPGACKPIGLTVSGEVVFPLECRAFIERALNSKTAVAVTKPSSLEPKPSAVQSEPAATVARGPAAGEKPADVAEKPATAEERPASAESKSVEAKSVEPKSVETKPVETKPVETKPVETMLPDPNSSEPKTAAKPSEEAAPDNSQVSTGALEVVPLPPTKRFDGRLRAQATSAPSCTHFRTYDATAGTYRGFDGKIRPCR
jgi:hypothetical protein